MAQPDRPLRADAARNRARVLEVAYETFAAEGLSVPIDEIARRAGVGAGTVYRHFPTKEDLYRAVVEDRIGTSSTRAAPLLARRMTGRGAVRLPALDGAAVGCDRPGLAEALAGVGIDIDAAMPEAEEAFLGCWATCSGRAEGGSGAAAISMCATSRRSWSGARRCRPPTGRGRAPDRGLSGRPCPAVNDLALSLVEC